MANRYRYPRQVRDHPRVDNIASTRKRRESDAKRRRKIYIDRTVSITVDNAFYGNK